MIVVYLPEYLENLTALGFGSRQGNFSFFFHLQAARKGLQLIFKNTDVMDGV